MRHRRFRQFKNDAIQQPADDLPANRPRLRIFQLVFQIVAHARAQLLQIFRVVFFGERVVNRRRNLFLHLDQLNLKHALFARELFRHEVGGKIHVDRALVTRLRADKLFGEPGDERVRRGIHPEILLLRQTLCRRRGFGDGLAVARAGVIHHRDVARLQFARDGFKFQMLLRQQSQRALDVRLRDGFDFAFGGQPFVFRQIKFRRGLDGRGELQILPATELDFLDVRVADHGDFLFFERLAVMVADELAFDLVLDVRLVFFEHEGARRLARTEARQRGLFLEILRDGLEDFIHGLRVQFHPQQFFARGQIFNSDVHSKIVG